MLDRLVDRLRGLLTVQELDPGVPVLEGEDFERRLAGEDPVLVLFYADWCGFCRAFVPGFRERVDGLDVDVVAANVSSEADPRWSAFDVRAVPTLVAVRGGEVIDRADARPGRGLEASQVDELVEALEA